MSEHAKGNAIEHAKGLVELYQAHKSLQSGAEIVSIDGDDYTSTEGIEDRAREQALSVELRSA